MNVTKARMLALMMAIMGGFTAVVAGKKNKAKLLVTSDTPELMLVEPVYRSENAFADGAIGCTSEGVCEIERPLVTEIVSIPTTSTTSRRAKRRDKSNAPCFVSTTTEREPVIMQEWEVVEVQPENREVSRSAQAYSRAHKYKLKQEEHAYMRRLTHDLQEILLINPLEHDAAGLVRSTHENRELAVQLADTAHALQAAGFKVNMAHVIAKVDELNEEPGTLNALARNYARQVEDWKEAHAHQVREVQHRDMIILEQEQKIQALEEQRELLIIKKEQIEGHTGKLKKELKKARHEQMSSEQLAAQAQAETAQAQELAQKALEQVQEVHVQMHKVHEAQGLFAHETPEADKEEKEQSEPTTDTQESEETASKEQTPAEIAEVIPAVENESVVEDNTTVTTPTEAAPTQETDTLVVSSESEDKDAAKEESETAATAPEKEESAVESAEETEIIPVEGNVQVKKIAVTETESKPTEPVVTETESKPTEQESTVTEEAVTPGAVEGEAEVKKDQDVSSFTPDWHK